MHTKFWLGSQKTRDHSEGLGLERMKNIKTKILGAISCVWISCLWFTGDPCDHSNGPLDSIIGGEFLDLATQLLASQEASVLG
jgi:hypothetical protein